MSLISIRVGGVGMASKGRSVALSADVLQDLLLWSHNARGFDWAVMAWVGHTVWRRATKEGRKDR